MEIYTKNFIIITHPLRANFYIIIVLATLRDHLVHNKVEYSKIKLGVKFSMHLVEINYHQSHET